MIFPNCPDVTSLFFQPQRSSTIKLDKSMDEKVQEHADRYAQCAGPRAICFQARDTSHSININVRNPAKKVLNHSNGGEACELRLTLGQCHAFPNSPTFTVAILSQ